MQYVKATTGLVAASLAAAVLLTGCREESDEHSTTSPVGSPAVVTRTGTVDATEIGDVLKSTPPPPDKSSPSGQIGPPTTLEPPEPSRAPQPPSTTAPPDDRGTP